MIGEDNQKLIACRVLLESDTFSYTTKLHFCRQIMEIYHNECSKELAEHIKVWQKSNPYYR